MFNTYAYATLSQLSDTLYSHSFQPFKTYHPSSPALPINARAKGLQPVPGEVETLLYLGSTENPRHHCPALRLQLRLPDSLGSLRYFSFPCWFAELGSHLLARYDLV